MVESFLKYVQFEKRFSPHTVISYQTDLRQFGAFLKHTYSEKKPELANYGMVRSWIVQLVESEGTLLPSTVKLLASGHSINFSLNGKSSPKTR